MLTLSLYHDLIFLSTIFHKLIFNQRIPKGGVGKISVSLYNFTHEIDAIAHNSGELSSFTRVKIIEKKDNNTVVVTLL